MSALLTAKPEENADPADVEVIAISIASSQPATVRASAGQAIFEFYNDLEGIILPPPQNLDFRLSLRIVTPFLWRHCMLNGFEFGLKLIFNTEKRTMWLLFVARLCLLCQKFETGLPMSGADRLIQWYLYANSLSQN